MADLTDIITQSVHDAEDGIIDPVTPGDTVVEDSPEPIADAVVDSPEPVVEEVSPSAATTELANTDDITKLLEAEGVKAPIPGQRENRLPHSRVVKIVENARKKLISSHAEALKVEQAKAATANERLKNMDAVDNLINTNPEQYLRMLANINPAYQRYITPPAAAAPAAAVVPAAVATNDPAPQPDAQFPDGSKGYTPEGLQKLLDWQARNVEKTVTDRFTASLDKRLGPVERERAATQELQARIPLVRAAIATAKQTWGALWTPENEAEIVKVMAANPKATFDACAAHVLVPKAGAQRTTMRAELLKEISARPKAAVKSPSASTVATETAGPRTMEQVIADSIKGLKR